MQLNSRNNNKAELVMSRSNFIFEQRTEESKEPCIYVEGKGDDSKVNINDRYAGLEVSLCV